MTYRAIVVDDEDYARDIVKSLIDQDDSLELVAECSNGSEAVEAIMTHKPDIVFLDIQMPEVDGFEVINRTKDRHTPHYIFTTAYDAFALKAFEVNAIDYLLKPFDDERFFKALNRAKEQSMRPLAATVREDLLSLIMAGQQQQSWLKRISVKTGGRIHFIDTTAIDWIEADNQYVKIYCGLKHHVHRQSLTELESQLDPTTFFRTHRSAIVNIGSINSLEPHFRGDSIIMLGNGTKVRLAKSRKEALRQLMGW